MEEEYNEHGEEVWVNIRYEKIHVADFPIGYLQNVYLFCETRKKRYCNIKPFDSYVKRLYNDYKKKTEWFRQELICRGIDPTKVTTQPFMEE